MEPTGKDLVEFWSYAVGRGLMNKDTAGGLRAACKAVLSSVEPETWESLDLRELDADSFGKRFERLRMGDFKPESLAVYQARFKTGIAAYSDFLESPTTWQYPSTRGRPEGQSNGKPTKRARRKTGQEQRSDASEAPSGLAARAPRVIEYPYPLRTDLLVTLRLPSDLTPQEAKRLSAFVDSLAIESQLALPSADAGAS